MHQEFLGITNLIFSFDRTRKVEKQVKLRGIYRHTDSEMIPKSFLYNSVALVRERTIPILLIYFLNYWGEGNTDSRVISKLSISLFF
jgi:hypothetical protein